MDNFITLPKNCRETILQEGLSLRQSKAFVPLPDRFLADGRRLLRAKVTDHFNFVDHPQVDLDSSGTAVSGYRCDCPDHRLSKNFCVHCAALVAHRAQLCCEDAFGPAEAAPVLTESAPKATRLEDLSYRFCNSSQDLYPGVSKPRIPLERYIQLFGNNARARSIYQRNTGWHGSCSGFVSSSTLLYQPDSGISLSDFRTDAKLPSQLQLADRSKKMDLTLHQFIEATQILQYATPIIYEKDRHLRKPRPIEQVVEQVVAFQEGKGEPVVLSVYKTPRFTGGHAILPFRLERISRTEDRLHIYDPNCPMTIRYATLQKDAAGRYLNWRFPMYDDTLYSSLTGGKCTMTRYSVHKQAWEHRGSPDVDNMLSVDAGTALLSAEGELLARIGDEGVESFREDIYQIPEDFGDGQDSILLSLPADAYTLRLEDPTKDVLRARLTGIDFSVTLNTSAREASLCVNDREKLALARICQPNCRYTIEILNTAGEALEETVLTGITQADGLHLMLKDGQLYADGLTEQTALRVNEAQVSLEYIIPLAQEEPLELEQELLVSSAPSKKAENP